MSLIVRVDRRDGAVVEITPAGEVDLETAPELRDAINGVITADDRPREILLNMRQVSFIDSIGISVLVAAFQAARISGARLAVVQPSVAVHRQLWVTGLHGLFGAPEPVAA